MFLVLLAWLIGFVIPDLLGLTEFMTMARFGIIKGHLYTLLYTNAVRLIAVILLFLFSRTLPVILFGIERFNPFPFIILVVTALLLSIILVPKQGIRILDEISFYNKKIGKWGPLFIVNRYLLHVFQITTISFMIMFLNRNFNPVFSGLIAGGLWSLLDLFLRNYRFGIYNILISLILSFSYSQFGSFSVNLLIGIIPQII